MKRLGDTELAVGISGNEQDLNCIGHVEIILLALKALCGFPPVILDFNKSVSI